MKKQFFTFLLLAFSTLIFAQGKVTFQADIDNRNGDVIYIKDNRGATIREIKANSDGLFKDTFAITDGFYMFFDGVEYTQLYLKDGYDLQLKMDAKHFDESIVYTGKGAEENNVLAQNTIADEKFSEATADVNGAEFNKLFEERKKNDAARLESGKFDETFTKQVKSDLMQGYMQALMMYNSAQAAKKIIGKPAPQFEYVNYDGSKTKLSSFKGKYVYIDVWATWCGPCRAEIPFLQKVEEKYHDKNIAFVSISVDVQKDFEKWKKFVADKSLGGTQLFADKNWESDFIKAFGINAIPRFILIDPQGNVVEPDATRPSDPKLQEQLDKLLK